MAAGPLLVNTLGGRTGPFGWPFGLSVDEPAAESSCVLALKIVNERDLPLSITVKSEAFRPCTARPRESRTETSISTTRVSDLRVTGVSSCCIDACAVEKELI